MDKIKILSISIIVILAFGNSKGSHAQFSFSNENCRTSFMPPAVDKWASSILTSTFAQQDSNQKRLNLVDKIIFAPTGAIFGTFWGFVIGATIPRDKLANGIKGGIIGFCVGPFLSYEMFAAKRGVKNPLHKFYIKTGGNLTLTNYNDSKIRLGYSIGIGRHYQLTNIIGLGGEVSYALRQFFLSSQKISYVYYFEREVKSYDIDFSVGYINTFVLLNFRLCSLRKLNFYISLGPSISLAVRDDTKFHFIKEEDNPDDFDFSYIMDEPSPLFGYPAVVVNLELQQDNWIWQLGFHNSAIDTDEIYPLISNTRLRTFELSIGYKL